MPSLPVTERFSRLNPPAGATVICRRRIWLGVENPAQDSRILASHDRLVVAAADADLLESQRMI
jgi:hypothetical protein